MMDLAPFYGAYRADGKGRPAYDPAAMVALLFYSYARKNRSSRGIERACVEDVACRLIMAGETPDHSTIAEFRKRHETAIAGLFGDVLGLCAEAGLAKVGVIALDGTKVGANASRFANLDYEQIARQLLAEHELADQLDDQSPEDDDDDPPFEELGLEGRREWLREAKRRVERRRIERAKPVPRDRGSRLRESRRRLQEDLRAEHRGNRLYEDYRARGVMKNGRRFGRPPDPYQPPEVPAGKVNITDPDSREVKTVRWVIQGYNPQAVVNEQQVVLAAEISAQSADFGLLGPMVDATRRELAAAGVTDTPQVLLADSGYWHNDQMDEVTASGLPLLIPPEAATNKGIRRGWHGPRFQWMRHVLESEPGSVLYRKRKVMIEPVFAQMKFNRGFERFQRRGRSAARSEWRLAAATHNLLKLHNHRLRLQTA